MACQDHVNILTCDKISLSKWVRDSAWTDAQTERNRTEDICRCLSLTRKYWFSIQCLCVLMCVAAGCEWVLLMIGRKTFWVSNVDDVWGVDVVGKQHRARGVKTACPPLPSSTQPLVTAVILPWQRVPPSWCDAYLYSWFNFEVAGLILLYDSSASRAMGGLKERLLAAEPLISCAESDNYTFKKVYRL